MLLASDWIWIHNYLCNEIKRPVDKIYAYQKILNWSFLLNLQEQYQI